MSKSFSVEPEMKANNNSNDFRSFQDNFSIFSTYIKMNPCTQLCLIKNSYYGYRRVFLNVVQYIK